MSCKVCNTAQSRYKCPRCRLPYCSVACWNTHKKEDCKVILDEVKENVETPSYNYVTDSTVPIDKLKLLDCLLVLDKYVFQRKIHHPQCPNSQSFTLKNFSVNWDIEDDGSSVEIRICLVQEDNLPTEGSKGLRDVLQNPHVRNMLLAIDKSKNPAENMESAMREPIFVEFVDECLKVVEEP